MLLSRNELLQVSLTPQPTSWLISPNTAPSPSLFLSSSHSLCKNIPLCFISMECRASQFVFNFFLGLLKTIKHIECCRTGCFLSRLSIFLLASISLGAAKTFLRHPSDFQRGSVSSGSSRRARGFLESWHGAFRNLSHRASEEGLLWPGAELEEGGTSSCQLTPPVLDLLLQVPLTGTIPSFYYK